MNPLAVRPLDTTVEVATPEHISFDYAVAGPFRRLPAFLFDLVLKVSFLFAVAIAMVLCLSATGIEFGEQIAMFMFFVLVFFVFWFYGAVSEGWFNGRTPGKWLLGIRVISTTGSSLNGGQALLRNLIMAADLLPATPMYFLLTIDEVEPDGFVGVPTFLCGLCCMMLTTRQQRLGDLAAGTMVVVDQRGWSTMDARISDRRVSVLASYIPAHFQPSATLTKFLAAYHERRRFLGTGRRNEIARHLTPALLERFGFRSDIDPDLLLQSLYYRTFLAERNQEVLIPPELQGFSPLLDADRPKPSAANAAATRKDFAASAAIVLPNAAGAIEPTASAVDTITSTLEAPKP
jgi:uncharacterized RDD family membrane protein YckC